MQDTKVRSSRRIDQIQRQNAMLKEQLEELCETVMSSRPASADAPLCVKAQSLLVLVRGIE